MNPSALRSFVSARIFSARIFFAPVFRMALVTSALCLIATGCAVERPVDPIEGPATANGPTWRVQHQVEDGALLSVWGRAPDDVWVAGGQSDRGLILHGDGANWEVVDVEANRLLWWIYGVGEDIYAVGDGGLILYYDGETWEKVASGTDKQLFGVWGSSEDDVWIVGGGEDGEGGAIVLHGSHGVFQEVALPQELAPRVLYKAYGHEVDDVVMVGSEGTILRYDGTTWSQDRAPTDAALFSLWGRSRSDMYAVGGFGDGTVLHYDGNAWSKVNVQVSGGELSGVFIGGEDPVIAVGDQGYVIEVQNDATMRAPEVREPAVAGLHRGISLHSVWGDEAGTTYAVGGELMAYPGPMRGAIIIRR